MKLFRLRPFETGTAEGRSQERYRRAALTAISSGMVKAVMALTLFVSVPLTLHYLGTERYGLWMTISAVIGVLGFSDLGINNSLMNGIAKANGRDDQQLAKEYVSSAFFLLTLVALCLGIAFAIAYPWIPWGTFFRVQSPQALAEAGPAVAVFAACFLLSIPAGIVSRVQAGYQEGLAANLWAAFGSIFALLFLLVVIHLRGSLSFLVLAMAGAPILALALNSVVQFCIRRPWLFPSWRSVKAVVLKNLLRLGFLFLILQLGGAIAFSSDNIVIARILGPEAVTQYSVPSRLFSLVTLASSFIVAPLWPAYGEALERRDDAWIRRTLLRSLLIVTGVSVAISAVLVTFGSVIIRLWVGQSIHPSTFLLVALGLWGVLSSISSTVAVFLNGLSVVRFQVIIAVIGAFMNIVLSVYLTRRIGIPGVICGSIVSQVLVTGFPYFWYVQRYIKNGLPAQRVTVDEKF
ncbi:oligosaccharide flippase family protein [Acidicapsa ligni]|uniref:oligosaccharide flippase family protein n=1 Tax=Acidicapsa ligni TaxID=542300 RepID=UPI0021E0BC45|nr:oligosaccharide flippase family protein [Acidicapsa ligni]